MVSKDSTYNTDHFKRIALTDKDPKAKQFNKILKQIAEKGLESAEDNLLNFVKKNTQFPEPYYRLSLLEHRRGGRVKAYGYIRKAIKAAPNHPKLLLQLVEILKSMEKIDEAIQVMQRCCEIDSATSNLAVMGELLEFNSDFDGAYDCYLRAINMDPKNSEFAFFMGKLEMTRTNNDEAIKWFKKSIELNPDHSFSAWNNMGIIYGNDKKLEKAEECYKNSIKANPSSSAPLSNLGGVYSNRNQIDKAIELYKKAVELNPGDYRAHGNLCFTAAFYGVASPEERLSSHQNWYDHHGRNLTPENVMFFNDRDPDKRLNVGFISSDFRTHPVNDFLNPLLKAFDKNKIKIFCYNNNALRDSVTEEIKETADEWREIHSSSLGSSQQLIRDDKIDILFDLSGHVAGNKMQIFCYKPAPIQISYLGYFATTGVPTIDYWLTDWDLHPEDTVEKTSEEIYRLPRCWLAYSPRVEASVPAPPPSIKNGYVTFGSFNNSSKIGPKTVAAWTEVLKALPTSRLILKGPGYDDKFIYDLKLKNFTDNGIAAERIELLGRIEDYKEHLAVYDKIDIALDTVDYSGGTTTAETMWMGVPVLTLVGDLMQERMSYSMIKAVGLDDWAAFSVDEFVEKAKKFAADEKGRADLRASIRETMASSQLCDSAGLARAMEEAFRDMWHRFLDETSGDIVDVDGSVKQVVDN